MKPLRRHYSNCDFSKTEPLSIIVPQFSGTLHLPRWPQEIFWKCDLNLTVLVWPLHVSFVKYFSAPRFCCQTAFLMIIQACKQCCFKTKRSFMFNCAINFILFHYNSSIPVNRVTEADAERQRGKWAGVV